MTDDDLCYMSATDAAARFRARTLSPVELMEAIIRRADSIAQTINPFADCYFDEARARARESETLFLKHRGVTENEKPRQTTTNPASHKWEVGVFANLLLTPQQTPDLFGSSSSLAKNTVLRRLTIRRSEIHP